MNYFLHHHQLTPTTTQRRYPKSLCLYSHSWWSCQVKVSRTDIATIIPEFLEGQCHVQDFSSEFKILLWMTFSWNHVWPVSLLNLVFFTSLSLFTCATKQGSMERYCMQLSLFDMSCLFRQATVSLSLSYFKYTILRISCTSRNVFITTNDIFQTMLKLTHR